MNLQKHPRNLTCRYQKWPYLKPESPFPRPIILGPKNAASFRGVHVLLEKGTVPTSYWFSFRDPKMSWFIFDNPQPTWVNPQITWVNPQITWVNPQITWVISGLLVTPIHSPFISRLVIDPFTIDPNFLDPGHPWVVYSWCLNSRKICAFVKMDHLKNEKYLKLPGKPVAVNFHQLYP